MVGGKSEDAVTSVEILDTTLGQWYHGAPIPQPCYHVSAATVGNMCYVLGGFTKGGLSSKNVFSLCLDYLISQAVPQPVSVTTLPTQSTSRPPHTPPTLLMSPWQTIPDTPLKRSSALALNGALLAVGGEERVSMNKAIHLYQPSSKKWVKVGELLTGRAMCACIVPLSGDILVAGGDTDTFFGVETDKVEEATIQ